MTELITAAAYFLCVFAKVFQQRNVSFLNYKAMVCVSYVLSTAEVTIFGMIAWKVTEVDHWTAMLPMILAIGTSGAAAAVCATWVHHKYFTKKRFM